MILKLIAGLVLSVTSFAAAFQYGGIKHDITNQSAVASVIVMNAASTQVQRITGTRAQDIKLPDATTLRAGYWYNIVNESTGVVTIRNSSSTLLGTLSVGSTTTTGWATLYLTSNATSGGPWTIMQPGGSSSSSGSGTITAWQNYTSTLTGFGTGTPPTLTYSKWRQVGSDTIEIEMLITNGDPNGVEAKASLPSGLTMASDYPTIQVCGAGWTDSGDQTFIPICQPSVTYLTFGKGNSATPGLLKQNGTAWASIGIKMSYRATVRVTGL